MMLGGTKVADSKRRKNGYNAAEVEAMLSELEKQLEKANSHNAEIDKRLEQAENFINGVSDSLNRKEKSIDELNEYIHNSQKAMQRQFESKINEIQTKAEAAIENARKNSVAAAQTAKPDHDATNSRSDVKPNVADNKFASMVGSVFLKAYESGSNIVTASKRQADDMLDELEITATKAKNDFEKAGSLFAVKSKRILSSIDDINAQTEQLKEQIINLESQFDEIIGLYTNVDEVRENTKSDISRIIDEYEQAAKELLKFELDKSENESGNDPAAYDAKVINDNAANEVDQNNDKSAKVDVEQSVRQIQTEKAHDEQSVQSMQQNEQPALSLEPIEKETANPEYSDMQNDDTTQSDDSANRQETTQNDFADDDSASDFADENVAKTEKIVEFGTSENLIGKTAGGFDSSLSDFADDKPHDAADTADDFVNDGKDNTEEKMKHEFHIHENPRPKEVSESTLSDFTDEKPIEKNDGNQPPRSQNILSLLNKYTNLK